MVVIGLNGSKVTAYVHGRSQGNFTQSMTLPKA